jgi:hypothetical protein
MSIRNPMTQRLIALFMVVSGTIAFGIALAQSPEGGPPVNEGICDDLVNATPGLYGLCVAFWAQDCEPDFGAANPFEGCKPGSQKILELYAKKATAGDPPMPGIQTPCPCWTPEELAGLRFPAAGDDLFCRKDEDLPEFMLTNVDLWQISRLPVDYNTAVVTVGDNLCDGPVCGLIDECEDGNCLNVNRFLSISSAEFVDCEAGVAASAFFRGLNLENTDCL